MNPETLVTSEQIRAICDHHNIPYISHTRITTGFSHEVHRLNNDLIIKLHNRSEENGSKRYRTEKALLEAQLDFRKPQFVAASDDRSIVDRPYIIMSFMPGKSLGSVWHLASEAQREQLIRTICQGLKIINGAPAESFGLAADYTWADYIMRRADELLVKLEANQRLPKTKLVEIGDVLHSARHYFTDSPIQPVHWDVHLDNFLVNDSFELQAFIDLETVEVTALDYPLFVIEKMMQEPEKFLSEADEQFADVCDYAQLKSYYQKYYPEMFDFADLEKRVIVYQMLDRMFLITDWPNVDVNYAKLEELSTLLAS